MGFGSYDEDDEREPQSDEDDEGEVVTDEVKGDADFEGEARTEVPDDTSSLVDQLQEMKDGGDEGETETTQDPSRWEADDGGDDEAEAEADPEPEVGTDDDPTTASGDAATADRDDGGETAAEAESEAGVESDETAGHEPAAGATPEGRATAEEEKKEGTSDGETTTAGTASGTDTVTVDADPPAAVAEELAASFGLDGVADRVAAALAATGVETVDDLAGLSRGDLDDAPGLGGGLARYVELLSDRAGEESKSARLATLADVDPAGQFVEELRAVGVESRSDLSGKPWQALTGTDGLSPMDAVRVRAETGEGAERREAATIAAVAEQSDLTFQHGSRLVDEGVETPVDAIDVDPDAVAGRRVDTAEAETAVETLTPAVELSARSDDEQPTRDENRSSSEPADGADTTGTGGEPGDRAAGDDGELGDDPTDGPDASTASGRGEDEPGERWSDWGGGETRADESTGEAEPETGGDWEFDFESDSGATTDEADREETTDETRDDTGDDLGARRGDDDFPEIRSLDDLTELYRVGDGIVDRLRERFGGLEGVVAADDEEIDDIPGVGRTLRMRITNTVDEALAERDADAVDAENPDASAGDDRPDEDEDEHNEAGSEATDESADRQDPGLVPVVPPFRRPEVATDVDRSDRARVEALLASETEDGEAYLKSKHLTDEYGLSARRITKQLKQLRDEDAVFDVSEWGSSTWHAERRVEAPHAWYARVDGVGAETAERLASADCPPWEFVDRDAAAIAEEAGIEESAASRIEEAVEELGDAETVEWAIRGDEAETRPPAKERVWALVAGHDDEPTEEEIVAGLRDTDRHLKRTLNGMADEGLIERREGEGSTVVTTGDVAAVDGVGEATAEALEAADVSPLEASKWPAERLVRVDGVDRFYATWIAEKNGSDDRLLEVVDGVDERSAERLREELDYETLVEAAVDDAYEVDGVSEEVATAVAEAFGSGAVLVEEVDGVGEATAEALWEADVSPSEVASWPAERLVRVDGVDRFAATRIARQNDSDDRLLEEFDGVGDRTAERLREELDYETLVEANAEAAYRIDEVSEGAARAVAEGFGNETALLKEVDGVGPVTAEALWEADVSPSEVTEWPAERLVRVDGVGKADAAWIAEENDSEARLLEDIENVGTGTAERLREELDYEETVTATAEDAYRVGDVPRSAARTVAETFDNETTFLEEVDGVGDRAATTLRACGLSVEEVRSAPAHELAAHDAVDADVARRVADANENEATLYRDVEGVGPKAARELRESDGDLTPTEIASAHAERLARVDAIRYPRDVAERNDNDTTLLEDLHGVGPDLAEEIRAATDGPEPQFDPAALDELSAERLARIEGLPSGVASGIAAENGTDDAVYEDVAGVKSPTAEKLRDATDGLEPHVTPEDLESLPATELARVEGLERGDAVRIAGANDNDTETLEDVDGISERTAEKVREESDLTPAEARAASAERLTRVDGVNRPRQIAEKNDNDDTLLEDVDGVGKGTAASIREAAEGTEPAVPPAELADLSAAELAELDGIDRDAAVRIAEANNNEADVDSGGDDLTDVAGVGERTAASIEEADGDVTPADLRERPAEALARVDGLKPRLAKNVAEANDNDATLYDDLDGIGPSGAEDLRDHEVDLMPDDIREAPAERLKRVDPIRYPREIAEANDNDTATLDDVDGLDDPTVEEIRVQDLPVWPADLEGIDPDRLADITAGQLRDLGVELGTVPETAVGEYDGSTGVTDDERTVGDALGELPAPVRDAFYDRHEEAAEASEDGERQLVDEIASRDAGREGTDSRNEPAVTDR